MNKSNKIINMLNEDKDGLEIESWMGIEIVPPIILGFSFVGNGEALEIQLEKETQIASILLDDEENLVLMMVEFKEDSDETVVYPPNYGTSIIEFKEDSDKSSLSDILLRFKNLPWLDAVSLYKEIVVELND